MPDSYFSIMPASTWRDALPCGNGRLGALLYGRVAQERILLNHERLYTDGKTLPLPDTSGEVPTIRRLLGEGRYLEANDYLTKRWRELGYQVKTARYQPGPLLHLRHATAEAFSGYRRKLDFATGEARVEWKDGNRVCLRRLFVSRVDHCMVLEESVEGGRVDLALGWGVQDADESADDDGISIPVRQSVVYRHGVGALAVQVADDGGLTYHAILRFTTDGEVRRDGGNGMIRITGARRLAVAATVERGALPDDWTARAALLPAPAEYTNLLQRHVRRHAELYQQVRLQLDAPAKPRDNESLMLDAYGGRVGDEMVAMLFNFGRYLLISSVARGSLPPNLQGIWNGDYQPPWNCAFFFNENMQMKYWQALPGGLGEMLLPLFDLLESRMDDFRTNARNMFGCRGILPPLFMTPECGLKKNPQSHVQYWTGSGGWLAQYYYDYWLYTGDEDFLRDRAIPFMREVAHFYEDFFVEGPDGCLLSSPSNSPENFPGGHVHEGRGLRVCVNATMDFAIARELLGNLIEACGRLSVHTDEIESWRGMLTKFPPYRINGDGAMAEWLHDALKDNYHHRHLSHIYPVFPGFEITEESDPDLYRACETALEKRLCIGLQEQTGWSLAHLACAFARMGRGNRALNALELITRSTLGVNGFTYHNDWRGMGVTMNIRKGRHAAFQVEANMGWTAAVLEMMLFCDGKRLKILPALPARWKKGSIGTIRCRGGYSVRLSWDREEGRAMCGIDFRRADVLEVKLPPGARRPIAAELPQDSAFRAVAEDERSFRLKVASPGTARIEFLFDGADESSELAESLNLPSATKTQNSL